MLQAQWTKDGIAIVDVQPPPLQQGLVRLRVGACGICGSDLHFRRRLLPVIPGGVAGHEMVGTVMAGPAGLLDRLYAVEPHIACGTCELCLSGHRNVCPKGQYIGATVPYGGFSEFIDVPPEIIFAAASAVDVLTASLAEPLAVCVRAIHLARLDVNSRVLVLGAGTLGLMCGMLALDRAGSVAITARYPHQQDAARRLGLTALSDTDAAAWAAEHGPDVVIETVGGEAPTLSQAIDLCRSAGRVIVVGAFTTAVPLNPRFLGKEISLIPSFTYGAGSRGPEFAASVSLLPRYSGQLASLLTHRFPLQQIDAAFDCAADKRTGCIKVTVTTG